MDADRAQQLLDDCRDQRQREKPQTFRDGFGTALVTVAVAALLLDVLHVQDIVVQVTVVLLIAAGVLSLHPAARILTGRHG